MAQRVPRTGKPIQSGLVPAPHEIRRVPGEKVGLPRHIVMEGVGQARAKFWREFFGAEIAPRGAAESAGTLRVRVGRTRATGRAPEGGPEGYRLRLDREPILEAATEAGAWWGLQTLAQLALQATGGAVPALEIRDRPAAQWRGFQLDLARKMSYRPEYVKRLVRELAAIKCNFLQLYIEHNFAWHAFPEIHEADAVTPAQAKDLEAYAADYGVTIIPATNLCRHMEGFLQNPRLKHLKELPLTNHPVAAGMLHMAHPAAWPLVKTILDEMLDAFSGPFFHLGFDETHFIGKHPASLSKTPAQWFGEWIQRTCAYVRKRGRRPIVWGDKLLRAEDLLGAERGPSIIPGNINEAIQAVPKDVIIQDWHYVTSGDATVRFFVNKGFETWASGALGTGAHFIGPTEYGVQPDFYAKALRAGAQGILVTSWGYGAGVRLDDHRMMTALAADIAWRGEKPESAEFDARWCRLRYGRPLGVMPWIRTIGERIPALITPILGKTHPWELPSGQHVRGMMLGGDPWSLVERTNRADARQLDRIQREVDAARKRLRALASRAERNNEELLQWEFYLDLYQHFLSRIVWGREVRELWYSMVNKMNSEIVPMRERVRRLGLMRCRMESLYDEMLGFLRIQRRLCAEQGMPVQAMQGLRKMTAELAESIQKVREMEATGIYYDTVDVFGKYI